MSIAIKQTSGSGDDQRPIKDGWLEALAKLVPGEIIVGFTGALQVDGVAGSRNAQLAILAIFAGLAPLVLWVSARRAKTTAHWLQYVVRTAAFVLYGFGSSRVLMACLGGLHWIPGVGAFVIALLAALILAPPGE